MVVEDGDSSSGWRRLAVLAQVLRSGGGQRDLRATFRRAMTDNEAAVVGVLPDGEARTRRLPRLEYLDVGAARGPSTRGDRGSACRQCQTSGTRGDLAGRSMHHLRFEANCIPLEPRSP